MTQMNLGSAGNVRRPIMVVNAQGQSVAANPKAAFRALGFGDPHLALPAPGTRDPATFRMETEELFEQILQNADLAKAHVVFCPGDWFHLKASTSYETVRWTMSLLRPIVDKYGPVLTVPGNHDMVGSNANEASTRQPISILEAAGLIRRVDVMNPYKVVKDGVEFVVGGLAYPHTSVRYDNVRGPMLQLVHADVMDQTQAERVIGASYTGAQVFATVNGHIHTPPFDVVRSEMNPAVKFSPRLFVALGTLTRVSRAEADWVPRCVVVTLTQLGCQAKFLELSPRCPGLPAFVADATPVGAASASSLQDFAKYLATHSTDVADPEKMLREFCFDADGRSRYPAGVFERASKFLEDAKK